MQKLLLLLIQSLHTAPGKLFILLLVQDLHIMFTLAMKLKATRNFNFWHKLLPTIATYVVASKISLYVWKIQTT
jgi:hypothetical protein